MADCSNLNPSLAQQLQIEHASRAIDACHDVPALRALAKQLHLALTVEQAATRWAIRLR